MKEYQWSKRCQKCNNFFKETELYIAFCDQHSGHGIDPEGCPDYSEFKEKDQGSEGETT